MGVSSDCSALGRGKRQKARDMAEGEVSMGRGVLQACPPLGVAKMQGFGWVLGLNHLAELYLKGLVPNEGVW